MSFPPDDWLPSYPDRPPPPRRTPAPVLASQPPHTPAIFPVPDDLASLTFLPSFPHRVPHLTTTREQTGASAGAWAVSGVHPLVWQGWAPPQVPTRRTPLGAHPTSSAAPLGQFVVTAQRLGWQARFPDRVPHRRPPVWTGGLLWTVDPSIPAAAVVCTDLAADTLTSPALIAATFTHPRLLNEGLGSPALIDEDLC
jgi:hypothetical protein